MQLNSLMSSYCVRSSSVVAGAKECRNYISVLTIVITSHVPGAANHPMTEVDEERVPPFQFILFTECFGEGCQSGANVIMLQMNKTIKAYHDSYIRGILIGLGWGQVN